MRILCIADTYPWPSTDGYRQRLANVARSLAGAGELDLFAVVDEREDLRAGSIDAPIGARVFVSPRPPPRRGPAQMLHWLSSPLPRAVLWHDWSRAGDELRRWSADAYDLVWYSHLDPFLALGQTVDGPKIVDLDNLENLKVQAQRRLTLATSSGHPSVRALLGQAVDLVDERRWSRQQREANRRAARVVVCSELDRQRLGLAGAAVVPNGYRRDGPPVGGRSAKPEAPVFTMVGLMTYPPNIDAAMHFARDVLPLVRTEAPGAQFKLVGHADGEVGSLAKLPGVVVRGRVPDVRVELEDTDVAVAPVRFGGGTRIKVLEAFAHHLPVVATTTGAEGIDAADGVELLIADDARAQAEACLRLVRDPALARRLAAAGARLYEERYSWDLILPKISTLASEVAAEARSGQHSPPRR